MSSASATSQLSRNQTIRAEILWLVLTLMICAHFSLVYNMDNRPFLNLPRYAAGQERLPFQGRVLMAWIFRALAGTRFIGLIAAKLPVQLRDPYLAIQLGISFAALFGAILFTRGSIRMLTADRTYARWAALLVAFMAYFNLPLIYGLSYTLPYDVPSLFFFCGCVFCVLGDFYPGFYMLFILGTFNRETICFVTLFFIIWKLSRGMVRWPKLLTHALLQTALWIGIKLYLRHLFTTNPHEGDGTGLVIPHLQYNLHEILKPQQWPLLLSNFGFALPLLVSQRAWIRDRGIARACAIILPAWFCLMFYVGVMIEIRIYTELISIVSLGVALILFHRFFTGTVRNI
jgi:hypothetical protein